MTRRLSQLADFGEFGFFGFAQCLQHALGDRDEPHTGKKQQDPGGSWVDESLQAGGDATGQLWPLVHVLAERVDPIGEEHQPENQEGEP